VFSSLFVIRPLHPVTAAGRIELWLTFRGGSLLVSTTPGNYSTSVPANPAYAQDSRHPGRADASARLLGAELSGR
jgi:hypothetical protein